MKHVRRTVDHHLADFLLQGHLSCVSSILECYGDVISTIFKFDLGGEVKVQKQVEDTT